MEYKIVNANCTEYLEEKVNELIKDGWQLQGGVSISLSESDDYMYFDCAQAMIKKGD